MVRRLVAKNGNWFMIVVRPEDKQWLDEPRIDDGAIIANLEENVRYSIRNAQSYMNHKPGWEDYEHDDKLVKRLMSLPVKK